MVQICMNFIPPANSGFKLPEALHKGFGFLLFTGQRGQLIHALLPGFCTFGHHQPLQHAFAGRWAQSQKELLGSRVGLKLLLQVFGYYQLFQSVKQLPGTVLFCKLNTFVACRRHQAFCAEFQYLFLIDFRPHAFWLARAKKLYVRFTVYSFFCTVYPAKTQGLVHRFAPGNGWPARIFFIIQQPDALFFAVVLLQPLPPFFSAGRIKSFCYFFTHPGNL